MAHSFNRKSKSHLIKMTNMEHKKSLHRLLGSIFLLVVAILILLNVTARTKPVAATKKTIDIHITETDQNQLAASMPVHTQLNQSQHATRNKHPESADVIGSFSKATDTVKLGNKTANHTKTQLKPKTTTPPKTNKVNNATTKKTTKATKQTKSTLPHLSPQMVTKTTVTQHKPTPLEILNGASGKSSTKTTKKFFVQIVTSHNRSNILSLQHKLAAHGVHTHLTSSKKGHSNVYQLRTGPFNSQTQATKQLHKLRKQLGK